MTVSHEVISFGLNCSPCRRISKSIGIRKTRPDWQGPLEDGTACRRLKTGIANRPVPIVPSLLVFIGQRQHSAAYATVYPRWMRGDERKSGILASRFTPRKQPSVPRASCATRSIAIGVNVPRGKCHRMMRLPLAVHPISSRSFLFSRLLLKGVCNAVERRADSTRDRLNECHLCSAEINLQFYNPSNQLLTPSVSLFHENKRW